MAAVAAVRVEKLRRAADPRGQVFEPLDAGELGEQRNVHVVLTEPGHIRGNHFHEAGTEITTVVGPARVSYRDGDRITAVDVPVSEVWRFTFPPGVTHAFQNTGSATMLIVSFSSLPHDPAQPNTTRDVIL